MATTALMTCEEMLAFSDAERFDRYLIHGELRERPMLFHSPAHSGATAAVTALLQLWLIDRPRPRPKLYNGGIGFRRNQDPDTIIGADVALATNEQVATTGWHDQFIEGPPRLAVEVLSATDSVEEVHEKVRAYLDAGAPLVWIVDPYNFTVTFYRPDEEPVLFNRNQDLACEPLLPGFQVRVAELFE